MLADSRGWILGGGVSYSAMAAARLGIQVRALIGVDEQAAGAVELDALRAAGVEVELVRLQNGPVFENRRTPTGRRQFALAASDRLPVAALPESWRTPQAVLLAPVAAELDDDWSTAFAPGAFMTLAVQGLLRRLDPGHEVTRLPFGRGPLVERADAVALSHEDVAAGVPPLRDWMHVGQQALITHGKRGSLAVARTATGISGHFTPPLPARKTIDPTGAGDTFIAAWLAARLLVGDGWRAQAIASVMSSLAVLSTSLADMPTCADVWRELVKLRDQRAGAEN